MNIEETRVLENELNTLFNQEENNDRKNMWNRSLHSREDLG